MQDDLKQVLTEQLRDIHLPEAVSWWPPAPGWWILSFIVIALVTSLIIRRLRNTKRNAFRVTALFETQEALTLWNKNKNTADYLHTINTVLKRIVLQRKPTSKIANQSGINWVESLNQISNQALSEKTMQALGVACYQTNPVVDVAHVQQQIIAWIESYTGGEHA